ncbi:unnamed protein product [Trichogramma brassicae]|uniref:C2H2-type domain-containing protein n=1 Tax=Trichogramma brassicae TaxID=86971 RepID=A0A6H5IDV4_9HYME|nr:unnamed protein product [Trichogramma brassicae]
MRRRTMAGNSSSRPRIWTSSRRTRRCADATSSLERELRSSLERCRGLDDNIELIEELKLDLENAQREQKLASSNAKRLEHQLSQLQQLKNELDAENKRLTLEKEKLEAALSESDERQPWCQHTRLENVHVKMYMCIRPYSVRTYIHTHIHSYLKYTYTELESTNHSAFITITRSNLLKHQKTVHEGRKDYACDECEKKFGHKQTLLMHQKTVHEETTFNARYFSYRLYYTSEHSRIISRVLYVHNYPLYLTLADLYVSYTESFTIRAHPDVRTHSQIGQSIE